MTAERPEPSVDELLEAAYGLDGPEASRSLYARWAATYDSGFIQPERSLSRTNPIAAGSPKRYAAANSPPSA